MTRLSTLDFLRILENGLKLGTGKMLKSFDNSRFLESAHIDGQRVVDGADAVVCGENECPNLLVLCMAVGPSNLAF